MESTTVSAPLPRHHNMMRKGFLLLIFLSHSEGSSVCIDDQDYECKDMGITKCLPKTERCSTAACDKPLPIEKPACRKHCSASESWCEERGECIERREVCDCGVDKIYCSKDTYSCESRQGISHSNIFNVCKDGTCRGNCSLYNQVDCRDGYFKCGDGCLAFSEISDYRNCEGSCILANQSCYRNSDVIEKLSSLSYHYIWIYPAISFLLSGACFICGILCPCDIGQKPGNHGNTNSPSIMEKILTLYDKEPSCLRVFLRSLTIVLYTTNVYLHINITRFYYNQYINKNASPWFLLSSVLMFILTICFVKMWAWVVFLTKSGFVSTVLTSTGVCLVSPVIWMISPILLFFVGISETFGLRADSTGKELVFERLKLFINGIAVIITICQGLPQLGLSIVYIILCGSENTWLLVIYCIIGFGYQILFFGTHICLKEAQKPNEEPEELTLMPNKDTDLPDATTSPLQNYPRHVMIYPKYTQRNSVNKLREDFEKDSNFIVEEVPRCTNPYQPTNSKRESILKTSRQSRHPKHPSGGVTNEDRQYKMSHPSRVMVEDSQYKTSHPSRVMVENRQYKTSHPSRSMVEGRHHKTTPIKHNADVQDQKQFLKARRVSEYRGDPYFNQLN